MPPLSHVNSDIKVNTELQLNSLILVPTLNSIDDEDDERTGKRTSNYMRASL